MSAKIHLYTLRLQRMFGRLSRDRAFWLAAMAGPLFWLTNYSMAWSVVQLDLRTLAMLALLYPVLEELAFRGAVQTALLKTGFGSISRLGLTQANWITSLVFALFHLWHQSPAWAVAVILPSLVFGFFRDRYNSTVPGIILHCFYNIGFFVLR